MREIAKNMPSNQNVEFLLRMLPNDQIKRIIAKQCNFSRIRNALIWLKKNNRVYSDINLPTEKSYQQFIDSIKVHTIEEVPPDEESKLPYQTGPEITYPKRANIVPVDEIVDTQYKES